MRVVKAHYEWDEVEDLLAGAEPPTSDDVSITADGRRLDTIEAARSFFEELRAEREQRGQQH